MKIKLDENIPSEVAESLHEHDVHTVGEEGLSRADDTTLWSIVQNEGRFFVTQDMDFSDIGRFLPGRHFGILLVRLKNPSRAALIRRIAEILSQSDLSSWMGYFVVATDSKVRVRKP